MRGIERRLSAVEGRIGLPPLTYAGLDVADGQRDALTLSDMIALLRDTPREFNRTLGRFTDGDIMSMIADVQSRLDAIDSDSRNANQ
jgi:hypothetical protein